MRPARLHADVLGSASDGMGRDCNGGFVQMLANDPFGEQDRPPAGRTSFVLTLVRGVGRSLASGTLSSVLAGNRRIGHCGFS
jgi:hypothetical protein